MPTYDENGALLVSFTGGGILADHQHSAAGDGGPLAVGVTDTDLTAGSVWFTGVGGLLQEDNTNFFYDNTNKRIGLRTNTPSYTADVVAPTTAGDVIAARLQNPSTNAGAQVSLLLEVHTNGNFQSKIISDRPAASPGSMIEFWTMTTAPALVRAMTITETQYVGVNELTPDRRLHVVDSVASTSAIVPVARLEGRSSGGAGAAGHGPSLESYGESSTTLNQSMGEIAATWETATHASRRAQLRFFADLQGTLYPVGTIVAPNTAPSATPAVNAWGAGAVDFGTFRSVVTEVASGVGATISGGTKNTASGQESTVGGGRFCQATGDWATVTGGGDSGLVTPNLASGDYATVCGGESNTVSGDHSWGAGQLASVTHADCFVWSGTATTASWAANTFTARCHGGARFYSAAGVGTGVQLSSGGNAWAAISTRAAKMDFRDVGDVIQKVVALPVYNYALKSQSPDVRHIGPVAEEFNQIFGFTEAESYINSMDISGVALAAIKALIERVEQLERMVQ